MSRFSLIYLGIFFLLISVLSFFSIIYSYYFNLFLNINIYIYTFILSLFIGSLLLFIKREENKVLIYEKILLVLSGYIIFPLVISIPYYLIINNLSFLDAYFESISGFTSTGFSIFNNIKHLDESLILWRSSSQWIGGLYFLFSIVLLIDIFDNNLKKSVTHFLSFDTTETLKQSFKILILYSLITFFIFIILCISKIRIFDSFNLAMTVISSGGFLPTNTLDSILNSSFKEILFSFTMLFSFFSLFLTYNLIFFKKKELSFFNEDFYLLSYLIILVLFFFLLFNFDYNFSTIFLSITSSISNIGISKNQLPNNLYFIFLILVIIGGSFFSTSSGIRFIKLYSLIKFSINELLSHAKPNNVYINKFYFSKIQVDISDIYKYFLSVIIFIISLFLITSLLTINDINIDDAFRLGILTLMNTVNSSMYGLSDLNFFSMNFLTKIILIIFMIIGRVELLTLLVISKKFIFKN